MAKVAIERTAAMIVVNCMMIVCVKELGIKVRLKKMASRAATKEWTCELKKT